MICMTLNVVVIFLKRNQIRPSQNVQNQVQHANPNVGPDGKNVNMFNGKFLVFAAFLTFLGGSQFFAHVLEIDISIPLEMSFIFMQVGPSLSLVFIFLQKYGVKGLDPMKEVFC